MGYFIRFQDGSEALLHSTLTEAEVERRHYAFPEERRFPLTDRDKVLSAIRFFNYAKPEEEEILAKAIMKRMKELGMEPVNVGPDNRFGKYYEKPVEHGEACTDGYLAHHGIKGMKWGVRNAETLARYGREGGAKPSKRQVRKAIRQNRKAYAKTHGGTREVGENTANVSEKHSSYKKNDETYQRLSSEKDKAGRKQERVNDEYVIAEDYYHRTHKEDSGATSKQKRLARENYVKAEKRMEKANESYEKASKAYHDYDEMIAKKFIDQYKTAAVKDLGFKDVEAGKKLLEEYGLMRKATNASRYSKLRYN